MAVQCPRHELLARTGFAGDQHRGTGLRQAADGAKHLLHRGRLTQDFRCLDHRLGSSRFALAFVQSAANEVYGLVDVKGFGKVLVGAPMERSHR